MDEGFNVAHNSGNGIINLALEMKMAGECDEDCPNIVQYILFPPHNKAKIGSQWELITECWIEPQQGLSSKCEASHKYLENKDYQTIASLVRIFYYLFLKIVICYTLLIGLIAFDSSIELSKNRDF